jgi:hypothetical protein
MAGFVPAIVVSGKPIAAKAQHFLFMKLNSDAAVSPDPFKVFAIQDIFSARHLIR